MGSLLKKYFLVSKNTISYQNIYNCIFSCIIHAFFFRNVNIKKCLILFFNGELTFVSFEIRDILVYERFRRE